MACTTSNQQIKMVDNKIISKVIKDILPWIEENLYDESFRVKAVSHLSGYSHWYFQRIFRKQTGYNLATYIRVRRIVRAVHSIVLADKELKNVEYDDRFSSQQNFFLTFNKYLNKTPAWFTEIILPIKIFTEPLGNYVMNMKAFFSERYSLNIIHLHNLSLKAGITEK